MGAGEASQKQTIKTLEEAPEGPPRDLIVRGAGPESLEIIWKVREEIIYTVFPLACGQHVRPVQLWGGGHFYNLQIPQQVRDVRTWNLK